ncbi:hypothetical protein M9H77_12151 [Catharanthus roseus]|uniref:Uncharacterized protein n=1 Tax=Catharanthus roseus TaxID=4058 RepID=A0ACC0BGR5_CATRO|nr:hypothetical protein M9H77_12151 [Catharanthus roseus]
MDENAIRDAWEKRASLRYKDLMYEEKMGEAFAQSELYVLLHQQKGIPKYQELKANEKCLHIENGSPMLTDEQLTFEAAGGSKKGHVYGFGSQSAAITAEQRGGNSSSSSIPLISSCCCRGINGSKPSGYSQIQTQTLIVKHGRRPKLGPSRYKIYGLRPDSPGSKVDGVMSKAMPIPILADFDTFSSVSYLSPT